MNLPRQTIARWMGFTAIIAVNVVVVRGFFFRDTYWGGSLMFFVLEIGLWRFFRSRGRLRCFWSGFELSGSAAVLALFSGEFFPDSLLYRRERACVTFLFDLTFRQIQALLPNGFSDYIWRLILAVAYFVPELIVATLGGVLAVLLIGRGIWSHSRASDAR